MLFNFFSNLKIEKAAVPTIEQEPEKKKMTFSIDYPNLYHTAYEIDDKFAGLVLTDQDYIERQSRVVKWLISLLYAIYCIVHYKYNIIKNLILS